MSTTSTVALVVGYIPAVLTFYALARMGLFGSDRIRLPQDEHHHGAYSTTGLFYNTARWKVDPADANFVSANSIRPFMFTRY